ncbi:MAG: SOS response-associated peptidase family protein [Alphaproteobacteria bacterium]|nr:SOS response-associated peptidase family protein [Alphaproteobacteria bacterium]
MLFASTRAYGSDRGVISHLRSGDWLAHKKTTIAHIWRKFEIEGAPTPFYACVMVPVPANKLIATLPADRMPAVLDPSDWAKWIGEEPDSVDELKAMLKTVEGVNWHMRREERSAKAPRGKPTTSNPGDLS